MAVFTEGNLQIAFDNALRIRKFDDDRHGLAHCMKAVDCIVEFDDRYLFIEIKDPQDPNATQERKPEQYLKRLMQGQLDSSLYGKYRDSFLYEWASGRVDKPVYYFVLIALDLLTKPLLSQRTAALERNLPRCGPQGRPWSRPIVHGCGIFNLVSWNERFPDYPVQRLTP